MYSCTMISQEEPQTPLSTTFVEAAGHWYLEAFTEWRLEGSGLVTRYVYFVTLAGSSRAMACFDDRKAGAEVLEYTP